MWMGLFPSVEGLTRTKDWLPLSKREFCQQKDFGLCISQGSQEDQNKCDMKLYEEIYYGNWLMWLWRLRKTTVCCLKAGNPGNLVIQFSVWVWRPKNQGSWWYYILVWVWRPKNWKCWCPRAEDECLISGKESEVPLPLLFCSIKALNRLDDAHLHWGAQSSLLSLPTQMLISSRNTS